MLDASSRDMTAFQTQRGVLWITSLPMGYTNSPAEFQACMMFILQDEVPDTAGVFIDDIPIKGPSTTCTWTGQNPWIKINEYTTRMSLEPATSLDKGETGPTMSCDHPLCQHIYCGCSRSHPGCYLCAANSLPLNCFLYDSLDKLENSGVMSAV